MARKVEGKRATGLEPATFSLEGCERRTEDVYSQELTSAPTNACTNACTDGAEIEHRGPAEAVPEAAAGAVRVGDADGAGGHFAEAVAMLARLPLTDTERAEAVRRLLADQTAKGKP